MSRSRKKNPAGNIAVCKSQKRDKQICNRIFRRQSKELIKQGRTPPVRSREVKNSWTFSGEAKIYFCFNYIDIARLLRKWS